MNGNDGNEAKVRLTQLSSAAGCAAKLKATELLRILGGLEKVPCSKLEVGFDGAEDALAYNLDEETTLVSTLDFFPPMADDPFVFGQIAAANALSDVYAMGASPIYALSIVCFPQRLEKSILRRILEGGISKAKEAGIPIAGGHTIDDEVPKYGLAVTGVAKRGAIWRNNGAEPDDVLVLTKPIGVGIINTAVKCNEASAEAERKAVKSMLTLNKEAREIASGFDVHAATDITGFGLLGHMMEMIEGARDRTGRRVSAKLFSGDVPFFKEALDIAEMGILPAGLYNNREYVGDKAVFDDGISLAMRDLLYDPQTSGGLLLAMSEADARGFMLRFPVARVVAKVFESGAQDNLICVV